MKKIIVILVVFLVMAGCMAGEMVYITRFYNGLQSDLETLQTSLYQNEGKPDNPQTEKLSSDILNKWEKGKKVLLMLQNHNTVRNLDGIIVSLDAVIRSDNYNDAVIFISSAINYIDDVLLDSIPYLSNIF